MEFWWGYLLIGLAAGVFGASLGVGGGIIMVPALVILYHVPQKSAQGISLAAMTLLALAATLRYMTNPQVKIDFVATGLIAVSAIVGAVLGAEIVKHTPVKVLQKLFAVVLVVVAVKLAFYGKPPQKDGSAPEKPPATERGSP
jgi:uncharacterized membrane protein YfcA